MWWSRVLARQLCGFAVYYAIFYIVLRRDASSAVSTKMKDTQRHFEDSSLSKSGSQVLSLFFIWSVFSYGWSWVTVDLVIYSIDDIDIVTHRWIIVSNRTPSQVNTVETDGSGSMSQLWLYFSLFQEVYINIKRAARIQSLLLILIIDLSWHIALTLFLFYEIWYFPRTPNPKISWNQVLQDHSLKS